MITPNVKAVNFAKEMRGRRLNGSVIRELEVDSEGSCRLQCVEENGCRVCRVTLNPVKIRRNSSVNSITLIDLLA